MIEGNNFFLDSNVWLYSFSKTDHEKAARARQLIEELGDRIWCSPQVINEVCLNLKRKSSMGEVQIRTPIYSFFLNYSVVGLSQAVLLNASRFRERHSFSFWDSVITASALAVGADVLYSEDMQDGFVLEDKLKIVNPFKD